MNVSALAVTGAPRERVFAWWTDYHENDHKAGPFKRYGDVTRRVVWREDGKAVEYEDEGTVLGIPMTFRTLAELTPPERVRAVTDSNRGRLATDFWFEDMPGGGTRITARAEYEPPKIARPFAPLTGTALHGALAYDLRTHVAEFEAWWKEHGT